MSITSLVLHDAELAYRRERAVSTFARVGRRGWRVRLGLADAPASPVLGTRPATATRSAAPAPARQIGVTGERR